MQALGGVGHTTGSPVRASFRNARLMRLGVGSDEIMKFLIAAKC
jgi:alkylation response protein AidB-like acyl-CoA dehydrogenase